MESAKGQELQAVSCVWPDLMALAGPRFWGIWHGLQDDEGWQAIKISGTGLLRDAADGLAALSEGLDDACLMASVSAICLSAPLPI